MEILAEAGTNHNGELAIALRLTEEAAKAGATAIKWQKRDNRSLFTKAYYDTPYNSESAWGPTYGEHREHLEFGKYQFRLLRVAAEDVGLKFYCTAFDIPSVDFLVDVGVDGIKLASGSLTNTPLLSYAASTKLPLFVSTGAGSLEDVQRAVETIEPFLPSFGLLQCTAIYPSAAEDLNLSVIPLYASLFPNLQIGYSSHVNGIWDATVAWALGARIIEKHLTLDRTMKGSDHPFSLEPQGFRKMCRDLRRAEASLGTGAKSLHPNEVPAFVKMSQSCYAASDLPKGKVLTLDDIAIKGPGGHLPPYRLCDLIGRRLMRGLQNDEPILEADLSSPELLQPDQRRSQTLG